MLPDGTALISIEAPCSLLNANHRRHFRVKARMVKAWRRAARQAAEGMPALPTPVHVTVMVHRHNRASYDAGNYAPTAKAALDGIVDAGLLPDDRNEYVIGPDLRQGAPWPGGGITVHIRPLDLTPVVLAPGFAKALKTGDPLWTP